MEDMPLAVWMAVGAVGLLIILVVSGLVFETVLRNGKMGKRRPNVHR
jgi:hypothetical protein